MKIIILGLIISVIFGFALFRLTRLERLRYQRHKRNRALLKPKNRNITYDYNETNEKPGLFAEIQQIDGYIHFNADISKIEMAEHLLVVQVSCVIDIQTIGLQFAFTPFDTKNFNKRGFRRVQEKGMLLFETFSDTLVILAEHTSYSLPSSYSLSKDPVKLVFETLACTYDPGSDQYQFELKSDGLSDSPMLQIHIDAFKIGLKIDVNLISYYVELIKEQET